MSKRARTHKRRERDFYPTPEKAVEPLLPHLLRDGRNFAEPCCGDGALVQALYARGFTCVYASDITHGDDVFDWQPKDDVEVIVTNPPWDRQLLHRMIHHLVMTDRPVWLLIDADWAHTLQAAHCLGWCDKIVSIGRVRWMPGTKMDGFDNAAWYRFSLLAGPTEFIGR